MTTRMKKNFRGLWIFIKLYDGKCINLYEEAVGFGVNERTIQRDIADIRAFLEERRAEEGECLSIIYDPYRKGYVMVRDITVKKV